MTTASSGAFCPLSTLTIRLPLSSNPNTHVTRKQSDIASFKTPGLRNVLVTGPYFHDGSMQTLWDVMDHYNKGHGITNP
jgi:cytochrome c peroxidase